MGILSWWRGNKEAPLSSAAKPSQKPDQKPAIQPEIPGMNGAVEVARPEAPPPDVTVFEFGSVAGSADKVTLSGYCPVSDELEPCRWEILPASGDDAPQFRVVF
ncbi:Ribonuclease [Actinidia chinensis var. chinensis]|uniref:Ribonuclease n=1 Tax=Actinidia chinensis var. chinensis TaxID=1590841 RepID=A0A2R6PN87_ACTCC|nr:Ribonuclease [Actinidia chinensis var. chinensis]